MAKTLRINEFTAISYEEALEDEGDVIAEHHVFEKTVRYRNDIFEDLKSVEALVAFHLGVGQEFVKAATKKDWTLRGGFNAVIPVRVYTTHGQLQKAATGDFTRPDSDVQEVLLRFPMPSMCAEEQYPGSCLEKLRCEIASYVYMQQNCPDVRIPRLFGFGFPNGRHYTQASRLSFFRRACLWVRQTVASVLGRPRPSSYLFVGPPPMPASLTSGYMIIECFAPSLGKQVPRVILGEDMSSEPEKRRNLFRSVSRIMLSLARIPQPRIGSYRFNYDGTIALANRPVTCDMVILERRGAPRILHEDKTYTSVDEYVSDMLTFHDHRFLAAPNAVLHDRDAKGQMAAMTFVRAAAHHFIHPERRNGPFVLRFADHNAGNMIIDESWNVTGRFDLEFLISGPADMMEAPPWLTWDPIDSIASERYDAYDKQRLAFMEVFREEERRLRQETRLSTFMEDSWATNRVWFYHSIISLNGIFGLVRERLGSIFYTDVKLLFKERYETWNMDAAAIAEKKVADRRAYVVELSKLFQRDPPTS
ncbi:hypothetical protein SPI_02802 [Niveomyces insectorum RCEF 264]|uniref:Aminoglycoside phosphotransferase n=1 Tax=Niveomyces insectorum RCEF 264 TaxID=1081102 RepID=A0A167Y9D4_9HYPO|nr:hypothetical protein SPI_02802 [Niveomyces insectorum RCEF 264]